MFVLECKKLSVHFHEIMVLDNITFGVAQNEITALIGPSGCGKSTLIKCFNRINELYSGFDVSGEILFEGNDVHSIAQQLLRRKVGMVFQRPTPFAMSIYKNIAFGPKSIGIKKRQELDEIVERSLRNASLWDEVKDRLYSSAFGLSGGQQQRLCIARALAVSPTVLLLDEPTSALDPISTEHIEQTLLSLKNTLSVVLVSHNLRQVKNVSDKTAFFEGGTLIEFGETDRLFSHPKHQKTFSYVSQSGLV